MEILPDRLRRFTQVGEYAPHKPLLLLFLFNQVRLGNRGPYAYTEVARTLTEWVEQLSNRRPGNTWDPFVRLQNDWRDVWHVQDAAGQRVMAEPQPSHRRLIDSGAIGFLNVDWLSMATPDACAQAILQVLADYFPETWHQEILSWMNYWPSVMPMSTSQRDPSFRPKVIEAYLQRCCVCGFNIYLGSSLVALEAAHVLWHTSGGSSEITNGIALCNLHHKLFDKGAFTIEPEKYRVKVSTQLGGASVDLLLQLENREINLPKDSKHWPLETNLHWHTRNIFKGTLWN